MFSKVWQRCHVRKDRSKLIKMHFLMIKRARKVFFIFVSLICCINLVLHFIIILFIILLSGRLKCLSDHGGAERLVPFLPKVDHRKTCDPSHYRLTEILCPPGRYRTTCSTYAKRSVHKFALLRSCARGRNTLLHRYIIVTYYSQSIANLLTLLIANIAS